MERVREGEGGGYVEEGRGYKQTSEHFAPPPPNQNTAVKYSELN